MTENKINAKFNMEKSTSVIKRSLNKMKYNNTSVIKRFVKGYKIQENCYYWPTVQHWPKLLHALHPTH
jgi:hypothetical protein